MSVLQWSRLCELAERHCRPVLLGLATMTDADRLGVLAWLCRLAEQAEAT